jgi:hypothetical protein
MAANSAEYWAPRLILMLAGSLADNVRRTCVQPAALRLHVQLRAYALASYRHRQTVLLNLSSLLQVLKCTERSTWHSTIVAQVLALGCTR